MWPHDKDRKKKNLPPIEPPAELTGDKLTNEEIRDLLAYEGIDIINGLVHPNKIKDKKLARMWSKARKEIQSIIRFLYD